MNVVIRLKKETMEKFKEYYKDKILEKTPPYAVFQAKDMDTVVTLYESGKVMFQGVSADVDASMWGEVDNKDNSKNKTTNEYYNINAIGSDEVGTGDYFGPIVVTSTFVRKEDIPYLESLKVDDSKKMDDTKILKVAPLIIEKIKYKSLILNNKEYNEKYNKDFNLNKIKAVMHNKVLLALKKESTGYDKIIVDEFAKENRYYEYLKESNEICKDITFLIKGESKNLAVACASIISRYIFINEMNKLSDKYHMPFPKGSGENVDKFGQELVEKYGKTILNDVAKINFANTSKVLKTMIL